MQMAIENEQNQAATANIWWFYDEYKRRREMARNDCLNDSEQSLL